MNNQGSVLALLQRGSFPSCLLPQPPWTHAHHFTHCFALTASVWLSFSPAHGFAHYSWWAQVSPPPGSCGWPLHFQIWYVEVLKTMSLSQGDTGGVADIVSWPVEPKLSVVRAPCSKGCQLLPQTLITEV